MNSPDRFPDRWLGDWVTPDGRVMLIERVGDSLRVTLRASAGAQPFSNPSADALPARWMILGEQGLGLRVEVGASEGLAGLGPTYDVRFVHENNRPATSADPVTAIQAEPSVTMGLYDDWEDDLGVPWAMPLEPWHHAGKGAA